MTDLRELIAETLAAHRLRQHSLICACGQDFDYGGSVGDVFREHARHVADAILAALGDRVLPEGGQLEVQWSTTETTDVGGGCTNQEATARAWLATDRLTRGGAESKLVRRTVHIGPWRPVDTEETSA